MISCQRLNNGPCLCDFLAYVKPNLDGFAIPKAKVASIHIHNNDWPWDSCWYGNMKSHRNHKWDSLLARTTKIGLIRVWFYWHRSESKYVEVSGKRTNVLKRYLFIGTHFQKNCSKNLVFHSSDKIFAKLNINLVKLSCQNCVSRNHIVLLVFQSLNSSSNILVVEGTSQQKIFAKQCFGIILNEKSFQSQNRLVPAV